MINLFINRFKHNAIKLNSNELKAYILKLGYSDKESTDLADFLDSKNTKSESKLYYLDTSSIEFIDLKELKTYRLTDIENNQNFKTYEIENLINKVAPELDLELIYLNLEDYIFISKTNILPITDYSKTFRCYYFNNKFINYNIDDFLDGFYVYGNTIKFGEIINKIDDIEKDKHLKNIFQRACILAHNENYNVDLDSLSKENLDLYNKIKESENLR